MTWNIPYDKNSQVFLESLGNGHDANIPGCLWIDNCFRWILSNHSPVVLEQREIVAVALVVDVTEAVFVALVSAEAVAVALGTFCPPDGKTYALARCKN